MWLGKGNMPTEGAAEIDLSGTTLAGYVDLPDIAAVLQKGATSVQPEPSERPTARGMTVE